MTVIETDIEELLASARGAHRAIAPGRYLLSFLDGRVLRFTGAERIEAEWVRLHGVSSVDRRDAFTGDWLDGPWTVTARIAAIMWVTEWRPS